MDDLLRTGIHWLGLAFGVTAGVAVFVWWREARSPLARRTRERIDASLLDLELQRPAFVGNAAADGEQPRRETRSLSAVMRYLAEAGISLGSTSIAWLAISWSLLVMIVVSALLDSTILQLLGILVGCIAPVLILMQRHASFERRFEQQLPEALDVMARSLQAGKPISACWLEMGEVLDEPLAPVCRDIHLKLQYGGELDDVLSEVSLRIPSEDVRFFFTALRIQMRSGGNLVALLRDQAELIRDRLALRGRIRAISSESRMSAWIMGLMPFAVTLLMFALSPQTMSLLWTTSIGVMMIEFGLVMQALGVLWIASLVRIRV